MTDRYGDILARLRFERGLTQKQVGEAVGVNRGAVASYELHRISPSKETAKLLADFFDDRRLLREDGGRKPTNTKVVNRVHKLYLTDRGGATVLVTESLPVPNGSFLFRGVSGQLFVATRWQEAPETGIEELE